MESARGRRVAILVAVGGALAVGAAPGGAGLSLSGKYALATALFAAVLWVTGAVHMSLTALSIPVVLTAFGVYSDLGTALSGFADPVLFLLLAGFMLAAALQARGLDRRLALHVLARTGSSPRRLVGGVMVVTAALSTLVSNTAAAATTVPVAVGLVRQVTDVVRVGEGSGIGPPRSAGATPASDRTVRADGDESGNEDDGDESGNEDDSDESGIEGDGDESGNGSDGDSGDDDGSDGDESGNGGDDHSTPDDGSDGDREPEAPNLQVALVLGVAYAASLGGVATLVGTPANAVVVDQLNGMLSANVTFVDWLAVGLPMVVVTLPVAWYLLVYRVFPPEVEDVGPASDHARERLEAAGDLSPAARRTAWVFGATAFLWVLGGTGVLFRPVLPEAAYNTLFGGPGDTLLGGTGHQGLLYYVVVGLAAVPALVLSGGAEFEELLDVDWATVLLLGGGLSLADALVVTDAVDWLVDLTFYPLSGAPLPLVLLTLVALVVGFGELASNAAVAAVLAPLLIRVGPSFAGQLGVSGTSAGVFLAVAGAVAASYGFALPVATPPNAVAYGTGYVSREQMLRAGLLLDLVVIALATVVLGGLMWFVWPSVL